MSTATALQAFSIDGPGVESSVAPRLTFSIPIVDSAEFALLAESRRTEVQLMLRLMERVHALRSQPNFVAALNTLALSYRHIRGCSGVSLRQKYYAYAARGDWRALVKGYKAPSKQPAEFVSFLRALIEQNHRSADAAIRKLRDVLWPAGETIPGYGTWMEFFARTRPDQPLPKRFPLIFPDGWHPRNLRRYGPTRAEKKLFQGGLKAAHSYLPTLHRDTSRLRPMELITIDDFWLNQLCAFPGDSALRLKPQTAYTGGLLAKCVGTRKNLARLLGPMLEREEKQADGSIKKIRTYVNALSVQALLYELFRRHGLPDYVVTILCENASASISPAVELMLLTMFEGRVRVDRTSILHHKTLENGFTESGGTPWQKGWIESDFNYLKNEMAALKGYKGSNERLNAPGWLEAEKKYALKFLAHGENKLNLPPEIIAEMDLPFHSPAELEQAFDFVLERSERRGENGTKHRMQGFDDVTDFRWPDPALPAPEGIDPHGPNNFRALALLTPQQQTQMINTPRKESPRERWERLSAQHPRKSLGTPVLALFLLTPHEGTYRNHAVSFTRNGTGYSYIDDSGKLLAEVPERTKLLCYVDFNFPESCLVCHTNGKPVGVLRMFGNSPRGVDITNPEAMTAARKRRTDLVDRVLAGVRSRPLHVAANAMLGAGHARNDEIVAAYQRETASLPVAEKIAVGRGEQSARMAEQQATDAQLRKVSDHSDSFLDRCAPSPTPAPAVVKPASSATEFSSDDLG